MLKFVTQISLIFFFTCLTIGGFGIEIWSPTVKLETGTEAISLIKVGQGAYWLHPRTQFVKSSFKCRENQWLSSIYVSFDLQFWSSEELEATRGFCKLKHGQTCEVNPPSISSFTIIGMGKYPIQPNVQTFLNVGQLPKTRKVFFKWKSHLRDRRQFSLCQGFIKYLSSASPDLQDISVKFKIDSRAIPGYQPQPVNVTFEAQDIMDAIKSIWPSKKYPLDGRVYASDKAMKTLALTIATNKLRVSKVVPFAGDATSLADLLQKELVTGSVSYSSGLKTNIMGAVPKVGTIIYRLKTGSVRLNFCSGFQTRYIEVPFGK